jgi:hypothetical protein
MARPSSYNPEFCEQVLAWGAQGKSLTWMAAALDISRETIYAWARDYEDFSDAITRAKAKAQAWWEDKGQAGMEGGNLNPGIWTKSMAARFPEDWRENKGVEVTGSGGGQLVVEFVKSGSAVSGVG